MGPVDLNVTIEKIRGVTWERLDASYWPYCWKRNGEIVATMIEPPKHCENANALRVAEMEAGLYDDANAELRIKWVTALRKIVGRRCRVNKVGSPLVSDIDLLCASTYERAAALARACGEWKEAKRES